MSSTTSTVSAVRTYASPADVRAFLVAQGHTVGARGKFSADQIKAFNAVHKGFASYRPGFAPSRHVVEVEGRNSKGRKVRKAVDVSLARKVLAEQGVKVGTRGPVSTALLIVAAGLTALSE